MAELSINSTCRLRGQRPRQGFSAPAFTVVELLLVIAIIATLIAIFMPALGRAREQARMTACLSNMRQIGSGMVMYMQEYSDDLPWANLEMDPEQVSPFTWGGFIAPQPDISLFGSRADFINQPAERRPFNKFLAPTAVGSELVKVYICPSDSSLGISTADSEIPNDAIVSRRSWETAGNSYAINWWWMNYYMPAGDWTFRQMADYSPQLLRARSGGRGSTFAVIYEAPLNTAFMDARPTGGGTQDKGWHRGWSRHSMLFLDAHAEHRYVDSRYPFGDGWSAWPSPN